jgi:MFS family permease
VRNLFLASAGASAAYLTVSEIFPMETRAMAIALVYSVGTGLGGIIGGVMELFLGVDAEGTSLEEIAEQLSARRS